MVQLNLGDLSVKKYPLLPQRPAKKLHIQLSRNTATHSAAAVPTACPCAMQETVLRVDICALPLAGHAAPGSQQPLRPYRHECAVRMPYHLPLPNGNPRCAVVEAVKENFIREACAANNFIQRQDVFALDSPCQLNAHFFRCPAEIRMFKAGSIANEHVRKLLDLQTELDFSIRKHLCIRRIDIFDACAVDIGGFRLRAANNRAAQTPFSSMNCVNSGTFFNQSQGGLPDCPPKVCRQIQAG